MTKLSKLLDHCGTQFEDSHDACLPAQPPYQVPVWELQRPLASQVRHRASEQDDQSLRATGLVALAFFSVCFFRIYVLPYIFQYFPCPGNVGCPKT